MVWVAIVAALCSLMAQHLGLAEEIAKTAMKIAQCPKCTTMWGTLAVLLLCGYDVFAAIALALLAAYASFWLGLPLMILQKLYNWLWQKLNR